MVAESWLWRRIDAALRVVNRVSQYDHVEVARQAVVEADARLSGARKRFREAKEAFEAVSERERKHQQEMNALLHRKPNWTSQELSQFTEMCKVEHEVNLAAQGAKRSLANLEEEVEQRQSRYLASIREHYHEEQVWAEKGRRISTYGTLGLILFNSAIFLLSVTVIEPGKREAIAQRVIDMNKDLTLRELRNVESRLEEKLDVIAQARGPPFRVHQESAPAIEAPSQRNDPFEKATQNQALLINSGTGPGAMVVNAANGAWAQAARDWPAAAMCMGLTAIFFLL
ncbi:Sensitive to high expression protein 9-like, mitochondrial [Hondaea fermentalgiana]|uniref:Sensitive to high expression protein 9-like, mitochondrial n=1 Tax=Hondaea fermentalgiana TaxID=2315210 RepID=A0A2R5G784_9STRA|nr:Sensitive to high expression protein 9-like, mitochondrial [Hondaea fermentalgiana]|eukprot:GBG25658.1 Sensitive to high expression protein 9-like, mitochondrial [Hondaea fermentalgiana]